MTNFIPTRLEENCSLRNVWRSFLKFFDENWNTSVFSEEDFALFYSDCLTDIDEEKAKPAKAVLVFSFNSFMGGRGTEGAGVDHEFVITAIIKKDENTYDTLALDLVDAIIDVFEGGEIPLYNFYTDDGVETKVTVEPTGNDYLMFPIFTQVELDESYADPDIWKVLRIYIDVVSDRSNRRIALRR